MRGYDKWEAFFNSYESITSDVKDGANYLEIGSQNLGWAQYLSETISFNKIVACDINPEVKNAVKGSKYTDVIIGDSTRSNTFKKIRRLGLTFDLILDDASHKQVDVLRNFMMYFPLLAPKNSFFVIEDTHTDFIDQFQSDNYFNTSIYDFFCSLSLLSTKSIFYHKEHNLAYSTMRQYFPKSHVETIISRVQSITFSNSMIIIKTGDSSIGERKLVGDEWPVVDVKDLKAFSLSPYDQSNSDTIPDTAVVYLNRITGPDDVQSQERFIDSYKKYNAECKHQLYVINKGFSEEETLEQYTRFNHLGARFIDVKDDGFDINAYHHAAKYVDETYVLFINTHTAIRCEGWLKTFRDKFEADDVGLIGATGSFESLRPFSPIFPEFPNYHIRSTGFMTTKNLFIKAYGKRKIEDKMDAWNFESGDDSITNFMLSKGLRACIVNQQGKLFDSTDIRKSFVFRSGNQGGLILADNQTRDYANSSLLKKLKLWLSTWYNINTKLL